MSNGNRQKIKKIDGFFFLNMWNNFFFRHIWWSCVVNRKITFSFPFFFFFIFIHKCVMYWTQSGRRLIKYILDLHIICVRVHVKGIAENMKYQKIFYIIGKIGKSIQLLLVAKFPVKNCLIIIKMGIYAEIYIFLFSDNIKPFF